MWLEAAAIRFFMIQIKPLKRAMNTNVNMKRTGQVSTSHAMSVDRTFCWYPPFFAGQKFFEHEKKTFVKKIVRHEKSRSLKILPSVTTHTIQWFVHLWKSHECQHSSHFFLFEPFYFHLEIFIVLKCLDLIQKCFFGPKPDKIKNFREKKKKNRWNCLTKKQDRKSVTVCATCRVNAVLRRISTMDFVIIHPLGQIEKRD